MTRRAFLAILAGAISAPAFALSKHTDAYAPLDLKQFDKLRDRYHVAPSKRRRRPWLKKKE